MGSVLPATYSAHTLLYTHTHLKCLHAHFQLFHTKKKKAALLKSQADGVGQVSAWEPSHSALSTQRATAGA